MDSIHALGAAVSMAAAGAQQVEGGNWRIFDSFLTESGATRKLGVEVVDIVPIDDGDKRQFKVQTNDSSENGLFDLVFYAAPWFSSPKDTGYKSLQPHVVNPIS